MSVAELKASISREINRGTRYDLDIPGYLDDAIKSIESAEDYIYMEESVSGILVADGTEASRDIAIARNVKDIMYFKLFLADGAIKDLVKIDPEQVSGVGQDMPSAYFYKSVSLTQVVLRLDCPPSEALNYEIRLRKYSPRPVVDDSFIVGNGRGLLIAKTLSLMAGLIRNPELVTMKEKDLSRLLTEFMIANAALRNENKDASMLAYASDRDSL